ncbi:hypothetical protein EDC96DRAFT_606600 [Choanephora cucurbitarum]|nr:hypothetical protein EDC96DRAFT_606600 [Choanephora cucurbitarum]
MATYLDNNQHLSSYTHLTTEQTNVTICHSEKHNCQPRPFMNIVLIVSVLIFIILRYSSFLHDWSHTLYEKRIKQAEEEEEEEQVGLMQRVE